jgi:hypothetical protein
MHISLTPLLADLALDSTGYRLLLLGHLLCVIVGFGSTFVYPFLGNHASKVRGKPAAEISNVSLATGNIVTTPFIYGALVFGLLLVGFGPYGFDYVFVQIAVTLLVAALFFSHFVHIANLKKMNVLANELADMGPPPAGAAGPPPQAIETEKRGKDAARNGGILHLAFAVVLVLMVWKPR